MRRTAQLATMFALLGIGHTAAQQAQLQLNTPVERALDPKDAGHEFAVTTKGNQAFTITVQQQGIDIVVAVLGPDGKKVVEVDNASEQYGMGGSEIAHVAGLSPGEYRVRVTPFVRDDAKAAKYTIALTEVRDLTLVERANAQGEKDINELEDQWERARDKLDIKTLTGILGPDAFAMGPNAGAIRTRAQLVAGLEQELQNREKRGSVREHTIAERSIKVAGNVGVSTLRYVITNTIKGSVSSRSSGQVVHVWAKTDTGWKLAGDYNFPFGRVARPQAETVKVDPNALSSYTGTYKQDNNPGTIIVTVDNGILQAQFGGDSDPSPKVALKPISDTTFTGFGGPTDEITFVRSANGEVRDCILIGDGPAIRASRVK